MSTTTSPSWLQRKLDAVDAWWVKNPDKRGKAIKVMMILWLSGFGVALTAVLVDDALSIKRDLAFYTNFDDPSTLSYYHFKVNAIQKQQYSSRSHIPGSPLYYAGFCDPTGLYPIAKHIKDSCGAFATDEEIIQAVLSFVQGKPALSNSLHYMLDPGSTEYVRYPLETLADGGGDCDCLSVLFASIAEVLGYDTILIGTMDHMFAAVRLVLAPVHTSDLKPLVYKGFTYYPCECTGFGWFVGEMAVPFADIMGALEVPIMNQPVVDTVAWMLPAIGAVVVIVIILKARKQRRSMNVATKIA